MQNNFLLPESSEKCEIILGQLMKAKLEMGSAVKKDAVNPFHKSKYASLSAHLEISESVLFNHGLLMMHAPNIINTLPILVATLFHPESGQWIKSYLPLPNLKGDGQGIGASLTYMRRYSINSMLGLTAEDDDGETAAGRGKYTKQEIRNPPVENIQPQEIEKVVKNEIIVLLNMIKELDEVSSKSFYNWIKNTYNAETIQEIPRKNFEKCMISLNNKIKYLNDQKRAIA